MNRIYLAGSCGKGQRAMMESIADFIRHLGYNVYCPFELKIPYAWDMSQEEWSRKVFDADIEAIKSSDIVFMISVGRESTAGTNWEQGYAFGIGKPVYVCQITDKDTSLMTYWGCHKFNFAKTDSLDWQNKIKSLLNDNAFTSARPVECETILT